MVVIVKILVIMTLVVLVSITTLAMVLLAITKYNGQEHLVVSQ